MGHWIKLKTLIVGCSFCSTLSEQKPGQWQLHPDVVVKATSGTGNQAIASRIFYECSLEKYKQILVFWSGINRLDTVISRNLHDTYPGAFDGDPSYSFCTPLLDTVWYHSGGKAGSWTWDKTCPSDIRQIFKTQYLGATEKYLSEISLYSIASTQNLLNCKNIDYKMTFIYNIGRIDYKHEHCFGQIDRTAPAYNLVDWNSIQTDNTVYDWAISNPSRIESDQFHPTRDAMREWILDNFKLDIAV